MKTRATLIAGLLALGGVARGAPFPTRRGETGFLDVPSAEVPGLGNGAIGGELRFDRVGGTPNEFGPMPFMLTVGLGGRAELGVGLREWGYPGDPRPSPVLADAALKLLVLRAEDDRPALAADVYVDRLTWKAVGGMRLIASTADLGRVRVAGYVGAEVHGPEITAGPTAGLAASFLLQNDWELVTDGIAGPRGPMAGLALRRSLSRTVGLSVGLDWLPRDQGFRVSFGFATRAAPPERKRALPPPEARPAAAPAPAAPQFAEDRPHFRMRIRTAEIPAAPVYRHLQHGPLPPEGKPEPAAPAKAAAPSPDDARRAQLRQREAELDAREKRLAAAASDLAAREQRLAARTASLHERERQLAAIQEQLLARERQLGRTAPAADAERQLEAQDARQLQTEKRLAGQERSLAARAATAARREQAAAAREAALRAEGERLAAAAARERTVAREAEAKGKLLATRERQLRAKEERHVAWRERLDALEAEQQSRFDRLEARQVRLAGFRQRLDAVAQRLAAEQGRAPAARKDLAGAFVVLVRPPTSIVRAAPASAAAAAGGGQALHPGVAVEKAVVAATIVTFRMPEQAIGELDREAVENVARTAARERAELLLWARAQSPALMSEAARRAEELKQLAIKAASLDPRQVVTRITLRPAASGVDVVVSALRERAGPAAAGAPEPAAGDAPAALREGETARRQIREALVRYQGGIEGCVNAEMTRWPRLPRTEEVLKLSIDPQGRVADLKATSAELAGGELEKCLRGSAAAWRFPPSDAAYDVEIPIMVVGAGAKP